MSTTPGAGRMAGPPESHLRRSPHRNARRGSDLDDQPAAGGPASSVSTEPIVSYNQLGGNAYTPPETDGGIELLRRSPRRWRWLVPAIGIPLSNVKCERTIPCHSSASVVHLRRVVHFRPHVVPTGDAVVIHGEDRGCPCHETQRCSSFPTRTSSDDRLRKKCVESRAYSGTSVTCTQRFASRHRRAFSTVLRVGPYALRGPEARSLTSRGYAVRRGDRVERTALSSYRDIEK
jgi:hypothetical protein